MNNYKIGYIAGVFDLFHIGHLNLLNNAKNMCQYLIVGILTDELVVHFKKKAPFIPYDERKKIIAAIRCVDQVVEVNFENIAKMDAWNLYHFDCLFSGNDYADNVSWILDKERLNEVGSDIFFFPYTDTTNSTYIKKLIEKSLIG